MVYVEISLKARSAASGGGVLALGAAVAPEQLRPSASRPRDFDNFWESKIKMLKKIPENAILTSSNAKPGIRVRHYQNGPHKTAATSMASSPSPEAR
jgi:hypothetical protein